MAATIRGLLTTGVRKARQNLTNTTNLLANDEAEVAELATHTLGNSGEKHGNHSKTIKQIGNTYGWDAITNRYGDGFKRANDLRSDLFRLPRASSSTGSLRAFSEAVERICRQLSSLSATIDDSP
ncbi:hypothetical protein niasHS_013885 [Heterodera schachtii]|uniref:Uncharacterized protein n=2 Tax=Heterodera TaxID=34509 RepID=A0ABD2INX0_HETSC